ncbi:unnamed protein product [Moneuplotes crassus]|uniref:Uncharacterized protein n=1 Tax=Euplotes crassus TaxID=5936 RepID=A0AAD2D6I7_EUPCR|nr:unnamed protein product [Moneuplotes crassus]
MKRGCVLILSIIVVIADVCKNDLKAAESPLTSSFEMPGYTNVFFRDIFDDQERGFLYFIGRFHTSAPWTCLIYKSDYNLTKSQVMTYDIYDMGISLAIDPSKDFIYILDLTTGKIFEIATADLSISRELKISNASVNNSNLEIGKGFYFSLIINSVVETCRWDRVSTNLDCFTFGVNRRTNFAPINEDLLFFGSIDISTDHYYLINYNFSDSSNLVWKKSINCPTSSCYNGMGNSLLSQDEESVYTVILYDNNFIFYKLNVTDGSSENSGFILNDIGFYWSYSMKEFRTLVAFQIYSTTSSIQQRLILVNLAGTKILKEYKPVDSTLYAVGKFIYQGEELMYHCGRLDTNYTFFIARSLPTNIDQLKEFQEETPIFTKITTDYKVTATTSNPSISSGTKTLIISSSSVIGTSDITSTITPSFTSSINLGNEDHIQTVSSSSSVQLNFTWACSRMVDSTDIYFSLAKTGSNAIPEWVQLDADKQELYLNTTPKLDKEETYYFSLQISFDTETYYKRFEITVEECIILNCALCKLREPSICETCATGYQSFTEGKSCTKVTLPAGAAKAAAALVTSSVVLASASSVLSLSSVNSIFSIMNSLQLAILLPLVPGYFSPQVLDFLSGMGFTMLSFDFIKFKDLPFAQDLTDWVSYPQSDQYLNNLGMRSGSSVVNYLSLMAIILLIVVLHFGVYLLCVCIQNSKHTRCKKFMNNLFKFFTFNIYIRVFIQAFMFTTLSIFSELYNLNLSTTVTKVSFGLCAIFCLCTSVLFLLSFYMYCKSFPKIDEEKYWPCVEYFNGVKSTNFSKLYTSLFMILRLLLCGLLVFGETISPSTKATYFYLLNIGFCLYLIIVRPLENPQDNIIEIINQIIFCCLAVPLSWLNTEEAWTPFYERYYTTIFMVSPAIGSIICLGFLLKSILVRFCKKEPKKNQQAVAPKKASSTQRVSNNQETPAIIQTQFINQASSSMSRSSAVIFDRQTPQNLSNRIFYPRRVPMRRKLNGRT